MSYSLGQLAFQEKTFCQTAVSFDRIRIGAQFCIKLLDRFLDFSLAQQNGSESEVHTSRR